MRQLLLLILLTVGMNVSFGQDQDIPNTDSLDYIKEMDSSLIGKPLNLIQITTYKRKINMDDGSEIPTNSTQEYVLHFDGTNKAMWFTDLNTIGKYMRLYPESRRPFNTYNILLRSGVYFFGVLIGSTIAFAVTDLSNRKLKRTFGITALSTLVVWGITVPIYRGKLRKSVFKYNEHVRKL